MMWIGIAVGAVAVFGLLGWRGQESERPPLRNWNDMVDQDRYDPQGRSAFFADGRTMRLPPAGTVAWGRDAREADGRLARRDEAYYEATELPVALTRELLVRGQKQYGIYCAACHGASGDGKGITTRYGMTEASYHTERRRGLSAGQLYKTITEGTGQMAAYGPLISPEDRWAIVAYVKVLQRAGAANIEDVPEGERERMTR